MGLTLTMQMTPVWITTATGSTVSLSFLTQRTRMSPDTDGDGTPDGFELQSLQPPAPVVLSSDWTLTAGGQSVQPSTFGSFIIPNVSAADQFGSSGPGSAPDFLSDDFLRPRSPPIWGPPRSTLLLLSSCNRGNPLQSQTLHSHQPLLSFPSPSDCSPTSISRRPSPSSTRPRSSRTSAHLATTQPET